MGAAAPGAACQRDAAATVALVWSHLSSACPHGCELSHGQQEQGWMEVCGVSASGAGISARNAQLWQLISLLPLVPRERDAGVLLCAPGAGAGPQPGHELRWLPRLRLPRAHLRHEP